MERLDKVLSNLGVLSRSETKKAIKQGRILINGNKCTASDIKINPDIDVITLDGQELSSSSFVYYMFHKPSGYVTAKEDKSEKCIFELIEDARKDLTAVGRLDKDTTGILLLTNDGQLNHRLLSPKYHVPKRYEVLIDGKLTDTDINRLCEGIDIGDDKLTLPAKVEVLDDNRPQMVALTITEGRFHQVKRMFEAVACPVLKLHRSDFGPLHLDEALTPGEYRALSEEELISLQS